MMLRTPFICFAAVALVTSPVLGEDFYKGKTVTLMVPYGLGASMGLYGRLVAGALEKYVPGNPNVIVQSRPGAGGTKGTSYAYNVAPSDGTYIAMITAGNVTIPVLRKMKYDPTKFRWLGSVTPRPSVIWLWHATPVKTLEEAKTKQIILGSTGKGAGTTMWPMLLNDFLGTKFKIVQGYKGGAAINKAAESGEVNGRWGSYSGLTASKKQWLAKGKIRVIAQFGPRIDDQPQAPRVQNLVSGDTRKMVEFMQLSERVGLALWLHPNVPKDRLKILRTAFMTAMGDPQIKADGDRRGSPIDPIPGEKLDRMVADAYKGLSPALRTRLRKALGIDK